MVNFIGVILVTVVTLYIVKKTHEISVQLNFILLIKNSKCMHTVKPVLSGHRIKRTPSIKRTVAEVPKFISLIYFK